MTALLFQPSSVFWRVNREMTSILAGPRAVLMQIAHPLVAAGVADHSAFEKNRLARLYRTSFAAGAVTFGTDRFASRAVHAVNRKHALVHGVLRSDSGPFPAGTVYNANAPDLKLWVLATIVDSTLMTYERFAGELSNDERNAYYIDSLKVARLFGIPDSLPARNYREFNDYMSAMLDGGEVVVTDTARGIVNALFAGPVGRTFLSGSRVGIDLLPPGIKEGFGPALSGSDDRWLGRLTTWSRRAHRYVPPIFWSSPVALLSEVLVTLNWVQNPAPADALHYQ
jgi:uncharacterized protein (DUF2236 family)